MFKSVYVFGRITPVYIKVCVSDMEKDVTLPLSVYKISVIFCGNIRQFLLAPMGVLALGSVHARPFAQRKFSGTLVCGITFKHLPQPLEVISEVSDFVPQNI